MDDFILIPALALTDVAVVLWTLWLSGFAFRQGRAWGKRHPDHPRLVQFSEASDFKQMGMISVPVSAFMVGLGLIFWGLLELIENPFPTGMALMIGGPGLVVGSIWAMAALSGSELVADKEDSSPDSTDLPEHILPPFDDTDN